MNKRPGGSLTKIVSRGLVLKSPGDVYRCGGVGMQQHKRSFLFRSVSSCNHVSYHRAIVDFEAESNSF